MSADVICISDVQYTALHFIAPKRFDHNIAAINKTQNPVLSSASDIIQTTVPAGLAADLMLLLHILRSATSFIS